jgi:RNA polymerase sigma-70 factor (ECF subfamily)
MAKPGAADSIESDEHLLESVRRGEVSRFSVLVQRHNRSLYRVARSIVRDEHEAEDVVQQTHVSAFMHLHQFEGRCKFSTWLARIATHEALSRLRRRQRVSAFADDGASGTPSAPVLGTPEELVSRSELARAIESAIDELPHPHRTAFVLRHVEGLDTGEAAAWLGVSEANLRVLLHRARLLLQARILEQVQATADEVFTFGGERCARVTSYVLLAVSNRAAPPPPAGTRRPSFNRA